VIALSFYDEDGAAIDTTGGSYASSWTATDAAGTTFSITPSEDSDPTAAPQASINLQTSDYGSATAPCVLYCVATATVGSNVYKAEFALPLYAADFPLTTGLVTRARAKDFLGVTGNDDDALIQFVIDVATSRINTICNRPDGFASASHTETMDGHGTDIITVTNTPITTLTSVSRLTDGTNFTAWDSTEYRANNTTGEIYRKSDRDQFYPLATTRGNVPFGAYARFPEGFQNIKVVYTGGYTAATLPAGLEWACLSVVKELWDGRKLDANLSSESIDGYSYTRATQAERSDLFRAAVAPYRTVRL